ncbi:MAG TPA: hypothetical protein PKN21_11255, partial [Bacteroidales bacterium]|nr:hypothetical protein [Bacteroidales bacterium]
WDGRWAMWDVGWAMGDGWVRDTEFFEDLDLGWWNMHSRRIENVHFKFADLNQVWQACYSGFGRNAIPHISLIFARFYKTGQSQI